MNYPISRNRRVGGLVAVVLLALLPASGFAQSETINSLMKRFDDAPSLFFYKNTLRMFNQADSKEFDDLVKNIQKMRFVMVDKAKYHFDAVDYRKLVGDYEGEKFEPVLTSRLEGRNFDVYVKDQKGSPFGTVLLVNDSSTVYILDILGSVDPKKASQLFSQLEKNSEFGKQVESFLATHGHGQKSKVKID